MKISQIIHDYCTNKEFRTIEFLCYQIYQLIKKSVSTEVKVRVILEKRKPDMNFIVSSAKCEYSDLIKI